MKELIFISFLLVVIVAFVVGYLTGKDAVKQKRRRTPHAPDGAKYCPECGLGIVGYLGKCEVCGYNPPRR